MADTNGITTNVSIPNAFTAAAINLIYTSTVVLQAGGRTKDSVNFTFYYSSNGIGSLQANMDVSSRTHGLNTKHLSISTQALANWSMDQIDFAINKVSLVRATFGAIQNRLEHKIDNLNVTLENLTAAESRIRDTDMATMMMEFTKNQILSQASQSMLAQANMLPQSVLSLLQ
jgi:flagellin